MKPSFNSKNQCFLWNKRVALCGRVYLRYWWWTDVIIHHSKWSVPVQPSDLLWSDTFHQNQHQPRRWSVLLLLLFRIGQCGLVFAPHTHLSALGANDPVIGSLVVLPQSIFLGGINHETGNDPRRCAVFEMLKPSRLVAQILTASLSYQL